MKKKKNFFLYILSADDIELFFSLSRKSMEERNFDAS